MALTTRSPRRSGLQPARDLGGRPRRAARRPARGIGLGRALLRWAVGWLERKEAPRAWLMVDGDNESALRLYRSEGFEVTRTRHVWSEPDTA
ncbi:MAG: GNAT family N-acetyltransferase [Candidatus Eisenbacteria bacterium]|uniref:GNAT family N-acetyltransferase n=1 Tax=Eiseniibacteriota bacterium TaxID=2212470 RepID=A0A538TXY5_UNCEI|nr:MAG: GNAT family N-acetyltransferase [Candidatus Eisenbacteria bacterium]